MSNRGWWIVAGGGVLTVMLLCGGAGTLLLYKLPSMFVLGDDTDSPTKAQIEGRGRFRLPPSATDVHARLEGFQDHILWVKFRMKPSDEAALWASSICATAPETKTISFHPTGPARPWWNPATPGTFSFRENLTTLSQRILIDKSNPAEYVVFIQTSEM